MTDGQTALEIRLVDFIAYSASGDKVGGSFVLNSERERGTEGVGGGAKEDDESGGCRETEK